MKLPLKWLREFVTIDASVEEISRRLSVAGLEVENIERLTPSFEGVTIARVLDVQKHPNADRLHLCQVDSGTEKLSIVCGAPNVQAGMTAALARVGAQPRQGAAAAGRGHSRRPLRGDALLGARAGTLHRARGNPVAAARCAPGHAARRLPRPR